MKCFLLFTCLFSSAFCYAQPAYDSCLADVNRFRNSIGLEPVTFSPALSKDCEKHAKYVVINRGKKELEGLSAHNEMPGLPGYSAEGNTAGNRSVICFVPLRDAINNWTNTFYHRMPFMDPRLKKIGLGHYVENGYDVCVLDCLSGIDADDTVIKTGIVVYPAPGQAGIPVKLQEELPNPIDLGLRENLTLGFPVTILFPYAVSVEEATFTLEDDKGNKVPCFVSSPAHPASDFPQPGTICGIAQERLQYNTTYKVYFGATVDGKRYDKSYTFTTQPGE